MVRKSTSIEALEAISKRVSSILPANFVEQIQESEARMCRLFAKLGYDTANGWNTAALEFFAREYGWTPSQVGTLTNRQIHAYVTNALSRQAKEEPLHEIQREILSLLDGKSMTGKQLATKIDMGETQLSRDHLKPLKIAGLIANKRGIGYYRPDRPPKLTSRC